jgi:hypothetical protein
VTTENNAKRTVCGRRTRSVFTYIPGVRYWSKLESLLDTCANEMATINSATHKPDGSSRPRKRPKHNEDASTTAPANLQNGAGLFAPFRALGFVTNHVPFVLQVRSHKGASQGPRVHILTCLGRAWALWEGGKMTLLFVGMLSSRMKKIHG